MQNPYYGKGFPSMEISNITKIIDFILTNNYLEFTNKSYIQTHRSAMEIKNVPHICKHVYVEL